LAVAMRRYVCSENQFKSQLLYQLSYAPYANEINELYQSTQSVSVFSGFRSPSAWPFQGCRGGQTYGWRRTYMRSRGSRLQRYEAMGSEARKSPGVGRKRPTGKIGNSETIEIKDR